MGQNLVNNPSFEIFNDCPTDHSQVNENCVYWSQPTTGTSDYFNSCAGISCFMSSPLICVPQNINGWQYPRTGNAYTGFFAYLPNGNYREYLQNKLNQKLTKNETYLVTFYVSLSDVCINGVNGIGFLFTKDSLFQNNSGPIELIPNYIHPDVITDKIGWAKICHSYVANGEESYITIGVFSEDSSLIITPSSSGTAEPSYYYLDDVEVIKSNFITATPDSSLCDNEPLLLTLNNPQNLPFFWGDSTVENSIIINEFGEYWVELTDGQCVLKDYFVHYESDCIQWVEMPNIFTPNGDGVNDQFVPVDYNEIDECEFTIVNRWGNIIYQSNNLKSGWDGKINDKYCLDGVYFWMIRYKTFDGNEIYLNGNFMLLK